MFSGYKCCISIGIDVKINMSTQSCVMMNPFNLSGQETHITLSIKNQAFPVNNTNKYETIVMTITVFKTFLTFSSFCISELHFGYLEILI